MVGVRVYNENYLPSKASQLIYMEKSVYMNWKLRQIKAYLQEQEFDYIHTNELT
jgi:hypothetical protein